MCISPSPLLYKLFIHHGASLTARNSFKSVLFPGSPRSGSQQPQSKTPLLVYKNYGTLNQKWRLDPVDEVDVAGSEHLHLTINIDLWVS